MELCFALVGGHAVEAWHGSELRHLSISQLPICVSAAEDCWAFRTNLSEVFWDDHPTVPGFVFFFFHVNVVLLVLFIHDILSLSYFFFLQNFYKQFKEMAAVMETVWLLAHLSACYSYTRFMCN